MTLQEVLNYFGSGRQACLALKIHAQNWTHWNRSGRIPLLQQMKLEKITDGKLKADLDIVDVCTG